MGEENLQKYFSEFKLQAHNISELETKLTQIDDDKCKEDLETFATMMGQSLIKFLRAVDRFRILEEPIEQNNKMLTKTFSEDQVKQFLDLKNNADPSLVREILELYGQIGMQTWQSYTKFKGVHGKENVD